MPSPAPARAACDGSPTPRRWPSPGSDLQADIDVLIVNEVEARQVGAAAKSAAVIVTEGAAGAT